MRVLLVDHDSESLETIARAIRGVLELDCVSSKGDALLLLRQNQYDVLIACERCVDGSGLDLLGRTTRTAQPLKRIFAAAPERLQLLGPRLAPFKVQRTINYPIDLEELWLAIAQVTGGPNDETDGTIERVVLDERGIPTAATPRAPAPVAAPVPLAVVPTPAPLPAQTSAAASTSTSGRYAVARAAQPVPEPPLRAPPPPRQPPQVRAPSPPNPNDTGRMIRALVPPPSAQSLPPTPGPGAGSGSAPPTSDFPAWTPEAPLSEADDFAQISAQARLGVQQKAVDEASRRKRFRLLTACGAAVVVAGGIVFLIEKFYDPEARARETAIAQTTQKMVEQQKVTDNLMLIEIDIEKAIMRNDLAAARLELAKLVENSPNHPRREFLQASIDRAAELAKLSPNTPVEAPPAPAQAAVVSGPAATTTARNTTPKPRPAEREPERVVTRAPEPARAARQAAPQNGPRSYGAPLGDAPRQPTIPLDAPINAVPTTTARSGNAFGGRTLEAGDASANARTPPASATPTSTALNSVPSASGSAAPPTVPSGSAPHFPPDVVEVIPAKVVKRVTPVAPLSVRSKTKGYVVVTFKISDTGKVSEVTVVDSSPQGVFDDAAENAVRKWLYEPRKENGQAVVSDGRARLVFDAAD